MQQGRKPGAVKVLPGLMPILGSTEQEAAALADELAGYIDTVTGLRKLASYMPGVDFDGLDMDAPIPPERLPEVSEVAGSQSRYRMLHELATTEEYTVRALMHTITRAIGHSIAVGTPEQVADEMVRWFDGSGCDGFNLQLSHTPGAMTAIAEGLVPELQRRGVFRTEYDGTTLREHLGLARPTDRTGGR